MINLFTLHEKRNRERAEYWISRGRPDYAKGSLQKAHKWQQKRREFEYAVYGAYPRTRLGELLDDYMRKAEQEFVANFVYAMYGEGKSFPLSEA